MTRSPSRRSVRLFTLILAASALLLAFLASSASAASPVDFAEGIGFSVGQSPQHEAVGDLNGDHIPDLVVTNWESGTASILLGNGDGTFQPATTLTVGARANGVVIGDFNGDGDQDLAIVDEGAGVVDVFLGNGDGTFKTKSTYHVRNYAANIAIGDFNGDGKPDLAVSASEGVVSILLNNGDGTFTTKSEVHDGGNPMGIAIGDFNGDGKADMAVADFSGDVSVFLGNGNGTFGVQTTYPTGGFSSGLAIGDFNEDGHPDLAVTNEFSSSISVLLGTGDGTFEPQVTYPVGSTPSSVAVGDLNGDGHADLAVSDQGGAAVSILLGDGEGNFAPEVSFAAGNTPSGVAIADFNGDGRNDLSVINEVPGTGSIMLEVPEPTFSTQASGSVALGEAITDTATIEGSSPTGTITFTAYGAEDENCEFVPAFESEPVTVEGNGEYESPEFTPTEPGTYRWVARYSGDSNNGAAAGACNGTGESVLVTNPVPTLSTEASAGTPIGGTISDTATIAGGLNPTGTLTFKAYGPDDATCSSPAAFTSGPVSVEGDGEYTSPTYEPNAIGVYRWVAGYSGDAGNEPAAGACNDPNESVTVGKASLQLSTVASGSGRVVLGAAISDTATIAGGLNPTGTITFKAYGPDDGTCSAAPTFTSSPEAISGDGEYTSADSTPTEAGTYRWVAEYSGDADNEPAAGGCNDAFEAVLVAEPITFSTHASGDITVGEAAHDTATLGGGSFPTGTVTFEVFGPDDATCASTPAASYEVTVLGDGEYTSADFTPTEAGVYRWVAEYSGDGENEAASGACNDVNESVVVAKAATTTSLTATPNPTDSGTTVTLTAKVAGAHPSGTVTFEDGTTVIGTANVGVDGTAALTTSSLAVGSHALSARYGGDAGNLMSDSTSLGLTVNAPVVEPTTPAETNQGSGSSTSQGSGSPAPLTSTPPPAAPAKPTMKVSVGFKRPPASKSAQGYRYTFRLSSSAAGSTFYCRLDNAKFKRCKSPVVYEHVKSGRHSFAVKAIAPSGAESATKKASFVAGKQG